MNNKEMSELIAPMFKLMNHVSGSVSEQKYEENEDIMATARTLGAIAQGCKFACMYALKNGVDIDEKDEMAYKMTVLTCDNLIDDLMKVLDDDTHMHAIEYEDDDEDDLDDDDCIEEFLKALSKKL